MLLLVCLLSDARSKDRLLLFGPELVLLRLLLLLI